MRPTFGSDEEQRPTFGAPPGRVDHRCIAGLGFDCPSPGPHDPPAKPDPGTVAAFPELEERPAVWSAEPVRCPVRWAPSADEPLRDCSRTAGHSGPHELTKERQP